MSDKESEMRDSEVPWFETMEELETYIEELVNQQHDYGTCVYAISMAATATFRYVAKSLGCTGFQAGCADLDIIRRVRGLKNGFRIFNYDNLLYPQYENEYPTWDQLLEENKKNLAELAREKLANYPQAHPNVIAHWKKLVENGET